MYLIHLLKVSICISSRGGREGYQNLLNTDMGLELDNLARWVI